MSFPTFLFYAFAAILVFAALRVVTTRNPVHAALWLVLAFFTAAAHWLMLRAEFLAIALVLVYVGAVMVLFLFVVMMLDVDMAPLREGYVRYLPVAKPPRRRSPLSAPHRAPSPWRRSRRWRSRRGARRRRGRRRGERRGSWWAPGWVRRFAGPTPVA